MNTSKSWKARNPEKVAEQKKRYAKRYPDRIREACKRWKDGNRDKVRVEKALRRAVARGRVKKGIECEMCRKSEVVGHHPDYDQRFVVVWLCRGCHAKVHKDGGERGMGPDPGQR
ncbi:MAG TPA: hypothetical protein VMV44_15600 [Rectinemataceae bacterium]|nr:hypothetical protein [Rectinemataceae bacterium]